MKKLFLLALSVVALSNLGNAQSKQAQAQQTTAAQQTDKMEVQGIPINIYVKSETEQMTKDLNLTPGQVNTLLEVNRNAAIKRSRAEQMRDAKQAKEANEQAAKYRDEQYQKILSKEQYQKWVAANTRSFTK